MPNAVWLTLKKRKSGLPDSMIIVYELGYGPYFVLDASQKNDAGEYPVAEWEPWGNTGYKRGQIAEDYGEFLLSMLKEIVICPLRKRLL